MSISAKYVIATCLLLFAILMLLVATNNFSQFNFWLFAGGGVFLFIALVLIGISTLKGGHGDGETK